MTPHQAKIVEDLSVLFDPRWALPSLAWLEVDGEIIEFNQSRAHFYQNCHRRYYWMFEAHLIPDRPIWPLKDGKAVHKGLEVLHEGKPKDEAVKAALAEFDTGWEGVVKMPGDDEVTNEHRELVAQLVDAYIDYYGMEEDWKVLLPEVTGRVEVGEGTGVFLVFRTDGIISMMQRLWLLETKTAKQLGKILNGEASTLRKYQIDKQITAYVYGVQKVTGQRIAGTLVNVIVKTKTPQFHREMFMRTEAELKRFEVEWVELCREVAWRRKRVKNGEDPLVVFYRNTDDCYRFGNCPYVPLCLSPDNAGTRQAYVTRPDDYVDNWVGAQKGGE